MLYLLNEQVVRESTCRDTRATDSIIKSGQKDTEASIPYGLEIINAMFPVFQKIFWDTQYKMNECFENVTLNQGYYNRTGIYQMDYSITYKLASSSDRSCLTFMTRGLYTGKILAPNLISHTTMALLLRTSLSQFDNKKPEELELEFDNFDAIMRIQLRP